MQIREVKKDDLDDIVKVFRECWNIAYKDLLPESVRSAMDDSAARELWKGAVEPHDSRKTFVAEEDSAVVAMARIGIDGDTVHLFSLYVSPRVAGKGVGSKLLSRAIDGYTHRTLWVFKDNRIAQNLYKKFGFKFTGAEKTDPRWQIPEVEMSSTTQ